MKKYLIGIVCTFISISSYSQVNIGQNLDQIKKSDSLGVLQINPNHIGFVYIFDNKDVSSIFIYFLNIDYICYATSVKPYTKESKKNWISGLNEDKDWVKIKPKFWEIDLGNNIFIECSQIKDDNKEDIFIFIAKTK